MNFRELINKLDHITEAEGITLQSIAAVEKAAMAKAVAEKAKGGWTGFTTWDPRVAGNIALAKLAQQNNFEGLFNSDGDFVVAYGDRTWSSNSELHPGENPRVVPPSPDDWKPLAAKGLVPQNAKGPAGLTNWLSSGGAQKEFDAVKKQSADVANQGASVTDKTDPVAQAFPVSDPGEEAKMSQLESLVDQYLKLKEDIAKNVKPQEKQKDTATATPAASNQASKISSKEVPTSTRVQTDDDGNHMITTPDGKSVVVGADSKPLTNGGRLEENIAQSLVESFGYQKKTDLHELIESFGYRKNYPYSTKFLNKVLTEAQVSTAQADLNSLDDIEDMSDEEGAALLKQKFGAKEKKPWTERNVVAKLATADWKSITWEDEIIPGIYDMKDLALDLGIAAGFVLVGTIAAPLIGTGAGAAAGAGYVAGSIFVRVLVRIALAVARAVKLLGKPFWEFAQGNVVKSAKAVGDIAIRFRDQFWTSLTGNLGKVPLAVSAAITMVFNGAGLVIEKHFPELHKKLKAAGSWVGDNVISPGVDAVDNATGIRSKVGTAVGAVGDAATRAGKKLGLKEGLV